MSETLIDIANNLDVIASGMYRTNAVRARDLENIAKRLRARPSAAKLTREQAANLLWNTGGDLSARTIEDRFISKLRELGIEVED